MDSFLQNRGLQVIFMVDCSDAMNSHMNEITDAINSVVPDLQEKNKKYPKMNMSARILRFSSGVSFVSPTSIGIDRFRAGMLFAGGNCELGKAFDAICDQLKNLTKENIPPILVLISDGHPTDDYKKSLSVLRSLPIYKVCIRLAFAVTDQADRSVLTEFATVPEDVKDIKEIKVLPRRLNS
ncbi:VWA domain-containing protein [bacterium]|nr:VWA domain-containing protein [bacterium]